MDTETGIYRRNILHQNIRDLLDSSLPAQISQLEESTSRLEHLAAYCEANYLQSQNKSDALLSTKQCALQSLAGVAYIIGELSRSLQNSLELEQINLKEKAARREIGKLTTAKNISRQTKIVYPSTEMSTPRYQRTAIDFSILDCVGHGRRAPPLQNNDYGSIGHSAVMNAYAAFTGHISAERPESSAETADYGRFGGPGHQQRTYECYSRSSNNYGTLSRKSAIRTLDGDVTNGTKYQGSYHSSMLHPSINVVNQQIYEDGQHLRYASTIGLNEGVRRQNIGTTNCYNINDNNGDYGTLKMQQMTMPVQDATCHRPTEFGEELLNKSADYSDDALPLPPPLLLSAVNPKNEQNKLRFGTDHNDSFPVPPSTLLVEQESINSTDVPNWVPHQYIEKAFVLYDYESRNTDELRLYQGAIVYVLKKNEDGWFEGVMDGITGLFPGNYVQTLQS